MTALPNRADRSAPSCLDPAGPRLPARLRRRRILVVPPAVGGSSGAPALP
jgi:hypothetical protein